MEATVPHTRPGRRMAVKTQHRGSTAFRIFNKSCQHPFIVENAHLRMKAGTQHFPVISDGRESTALAIAGEMIPASDTIINMVRYYQEGAKIGIPDNNVARRVYSTILEHLQAHLKAMREDIRYEPPDDNLLIEMGEFAMAIYARISDGKKPEKGRDHLGKTLDTIQSARAWIQVDQDRPIAAKQRQQLPEVARTMDSIEAYLNSLRR